MRALPVEVRGADLNARVRQVHVHEMASRILRTDVALAGERRHGDGVFAE